MSNLPANLASKTFGVEMEFVAANVTRADVAAAVQAAGVACYDARYTHATSTQWKMVYDGSVRGNAGEESMEIVSPVLMGDTGLAEIEKVCAVLQRLGAKVNKSCGLHVHIGAADLSVKAMRRLAVIYAQNETVIDSLLPASRRASANNYCGSIKGLNMAALATASDAAGIAVAINGGGRYVKLNFTAFRKHRTVEFRHHSGTVDAVKVNAWVKACLRMVGTAEKEQETAIMVPTASAPQGSLRLRRIYDMVARPEGASRDEIRTMLGRNTAPPVTKILTQAGIGFTFRRGRYYISTQAVRVPTATVSLATWCAQLEMTEAERAFWFARAALLNSNNPAELAA